MDREKAIDIAREHILSMNRENPVEGIKWKVSIPKEFSSFWYFDYEFERTTESDESIMMSGAPGFKIGKEDSTCSDLSWSQYHELAKEK
ncbi:MAG: hypothetical protein RIF36_11455 [Imperialibacter sp.]|uniref:hypothetical protein n=1 Tax=Imperialibacter sp. TaxID=2038411 RepID=UPI0032EE974F